MKTLPRSKREFQIRSQKMVIKAGCCIGQITIECVNSIEYKKSCRFINFCNKRMLNKVTNSLYDSKLIVIILKLQSCSYQREFAQLKGFKFKIFLGMCSRKHLIMAFNAVGFDRLCG